LSDDPIAAVDDVHGAAYDDRLRRRRPGSPRTRTAGCAEHQQARARRLTGSQCDARRERGRAQARNGRPNELATIHALPPVRG